MKFNAALLAGALLLSVVLACSFSTNSNSNSSSGAFSKITMAKDDGKGAPGDETNTFQPSDRMVHVLATLKAPKEGTRIKFSWWMVEAAGRTNHMLKEIAYTTGSDKIVHGHLSYDRDWPTGKYKCDIYVEGVLDRTIEYYVA